MGGQATTRFIQGSRHTAVPREVRQLLFKALRQAIPDDWLLDPELGQYFWAHLATLHKQAYLDQGPPEIVN